MRILLVTPPMTQLNTPYPATAYLTGCLRAHAGDGRAGRAGGRLDRALPAALSRAGLAAVRERLERAGAGRRKRGPERTASTEHFLAHAEEYVALVEPVLRFLQGRDPTLALRIVGRTLLPEGPRFAALDDPEDERLAWAFGELGTTDRARHLASLFVDDLADVVRDGIDPRFELSRYGEKLAESAATFDALAEALDGPPTLVDETARRAGRRAGARARARRRRADRAVPRQRLRRVAHRARGEGAMRPAAQGRARRRLRQHRAAPAHRPARVRLGRLHHARRRRAAVAGADRSPARSGRGRCSARTCARRGGWC